MSRPENAARKQRGRGKSSRNEKSKTASSAEAQAARYEVPLPLLERPNCTQLFGDECLRLSLHWGAVSRHVHPPSTPAGGFASSMSSTSSSKLASTEHVTVALDATLHCFDWNDEPQGSVSAVHPQMGTFAAHYRALRNPRGSAAALAAAGGSGVGGGGGATAGPTQPPPSGGGESSRRSSGPPQPPQEEEGDVMFVNLSRCDDDTCGVLLSVMLFSTKIALSDLPGLHCRIERRSIRGDATARSASSKEYEWYPGQNSGYTVIGNVPVRSSEDSSAQAAFVVMIRKVMGSLAVAPAVPPPSERGARGAAAVSGTSSCCSTATVSPVAAAAAGGGGRGTQVFVPAPAAPHAEGGGSAADADAEEVSTYLWEIVSIDEACDAEDVSGVHECARHRGLAHPEGYVGFRELAYPLLDARSNHGPGEDDAEADCSTEEEDDDDVDEAASDMQEVRSRSRLGSNTQQASAQSSVDLSHGSTLTHRFINGRRRSSTLSASMPQANKQQAPKSPLVKLLAIVPRVVREGTRRYNVGRGVTPGGRKKPRVKAHRGENAGGDGNDGCGGGGGPHDDDECERGAAFDSGSSEEDEAVLTDTLRTFVPLFDAKTVVRFDDGTYNVGSTRSALREHYPTWREAALERSTTTGNGNGGAAGGGGGAEMLDEPSFVVPGQQQFVSSSTDTWSAVFNPAVSTNSETSAGAILGVHASALGGGLSAALSTTLSATIAPPLSSHTARLPSASPHPLDGGTVSRALLFPNPSLSMASPGASNSKMTATLTTKSPMRSPVVDGLRGVSTAGSHNNSNAQPLPVREIVDMFSMLDGHDVAESKPPLPLAMRSQIDRQVARRQQQHNSTAVQQRNQGNRRSEVNFGIGGSRRGTGLGRNSTWGNSSTADPHAPTPFRLDQRSGGGSRGSLFRSVRVDSVFSQSSGGGGTPRAAAGGGDLHQYHRATVNGRANSSVSTDVLLLSSRTQRRTSRNGAAAAAGMPLIAVDSSAVVENPSDAAAAALGAPLTSSPEGRRHTAVPSHYPSDVWGNGGGGGASSAPQSYQRDRDEADSRGVSPVPRHALVNGHPQQHYHHLHNRTATLSSVSARGSFPSETAPLLLPIPPSPTTSATPHQRSQVVVADGRVARVAASHEPNGSSPPVLLSQQLLESLALPPMPTTPAGQQQSRKVSDDRRSSGGDAAASAAHWPANGDDGGRQPLLRWSRVGTSARDGGRVQPPMSSETNAVAATSTTTLALPDVANPFRTPSYKDRRSSLRDATSRRLLLQGHEGDPRRTSGVSSSHSRRLSQSDVRHRRRQSSKAADTLESIRTILAGLLPLVTPPRDNAPPAPIRSGNRLA